MKGSAGGLSRIDAIFGGNGYTVTFSNAPIPFGAFPSLHSGSATMEALFLSYFFPRFRPAYWVYVAVLYWVRFGWCRTSRRTCNRLNPSCRPLVDDVSYAPLPD